MEEASRGPLRGVALVALFAGLGPLASTSTYFALSALESGRSAFKGVFLESLIAAAYTTAGVPALLCGCLVVFFRRRGRHGLSLVWLAALLATAVWLLVAITFGLGGLPVRMSEPAAIFLMFAAAALFLALPAATICWALARVLRLL